MQMYESMPNCRGPGVDRKTYIICSRLLRLSDVARGRLGKAHPHTVITRGLLDPTEGSGPTIGGGSGMSWESTRTSG